MENRTQYLNDHEYIDSVDHSIPPSTSFDGKELDLYSPVTDANNCFWHLKNTYNGHHIVSYLIFYSSPHPPHSNKTRWISHITIQCLLTFLVYSVCGYNPLCLPISITDCLMFDKRVHTTYRKTTNTTIIQLSYTTFIDRQHNGLYIPSLLVNQLKSVRRNWMYALTQSMRHNMHYLALAWLLCTLITITPQTCLMVLF